MRRYEMMVIIRDELDEEGAQGVVQRIRDLVEQLEGRIVDEADWGKRKFAYEIDHQNYGWYVIFDVELSVEAKVEIERQLRISDNVLRFLTVRPDAHVHRSKSA
jgi:small subunit ribosomal protein S6